MNDWRNLLGSSFLSATFLVPITLPMGNFCGMHAGGCGIEMPPAASLLPIDSKPIVTEHKGTLTPVPVEIDPLGAPGGDAPWTLHASVFNVRSGPSTSTSILGQITAGTQVNGVYHRVLETDEEWINFTYRGDDAWISATGVNRVHPTNAENIAQHGDLPINSEIVNRWWGIPIDYEASDLVDLAVGYRLNSGRSYPLREEVNAALRRMIDDARADGVDMLVLSAYRSGPRQKQIYDGNVSSAGLNQRFSAPPGHSEHQLGTTVDIASPTTRTFIDNNSPQHDWLVQNGQFYGFRQTYKADNTNETGYIEEPWHWRFLGVEATTAPGWEVY